jgi:hypothetical protein
MKRKHFIKVVEDSLDSLPGRISQPHKERRDPRRGFPAEPVNTPAGAATAIASRHLSGAPATKKSVFDLPMRNDPCKC